MSILHEQLPLFVFAVGAILFALATRRLSREVPIADEPLKSAGLSWAERAQIRGMIRRRTLPEDPNMRTLVFRRAEYVAKNAPSFLIWEPMVLAGFLLMTCVLYVFHSAVVAVVMVQSPLLVFLVFGSVTSRRAVKTSRELHARGSFDLS